MINYNYFNCIKDKQLNKGLKPGAITSCNQEKNIKKTIINKTRPMMGWVDLPYQNIELVEDIELFGKKISRLYENFVVVGLGGSSLGSKAVRDAWGQQNNCKIEFLDNVDAYSFDNLFSKLDVKKTMFNIVTKSGTTVETLTMFAYILDKLKKELKTEYFVNIVVTTEKDNVLYNYCTNNNIKVYEISKEVGGRFSVLSPVGLLPCAVMGLDLKKLLDGAKRVLENFKQQKTKSNLCLLSANNMYLHLQNKYKEIVFLIYSSKLSSFADYYIQLLSESLGKEKLLNNKQNKLFFTPYKADGVAFQHSLLQMFAEGEKHRLYTFFGLKKDKCDLRVPKTKDANLDKYLPKTFSELFNASMLGTKLALKQSGSPSCDVCFENLNEQTIGEFLYYCQLTTAILGELMQVNTYNQPGVEQEKIYTKALLNFEGFEDVNKQLTSNLKDTSKFEV